MVFVDFPQIGTPCSYDWGKIAVFENAKNIIKPHCQKVCEEATIEMQYEISLPQKVL